MEKYFIGAEGLVTYPQAFPSCSGGASGANYPDPAAAAKACKKARVGGGIIKALVGARNNPTSSANCVLNLNLYNLKPGNYGDAGKIGKNGGLAIRLDGDPPPPPSLDDQYKGAVPRRAARVDPGPVQDGQDQGRDVGRAAVHGSARAPAPGAGPRRDRAARSTSSIKKLVSKKPIKIKGKKRKVGFYSAVGCKGGKRSIQVTFVSETGQKSPVTKDKKC